MESVAAGILQHIRYFGASVDLKQVQSIQFNQMLNKKA